MKNGLIGKYQLKARMKAALPSNSILNKEAIEVMSQTLNNIFEDVMKQIASEPYREITGHIVAKQCNKYFVQGNSLNKTTRILKEIRSRIDEWFQLLEEGKVFEKNDSK